MSASDSSPSSRFNAPRAVLRRWANPWPETPALRRSLGCWLASFALSVTGAAAADLEERTAAAFERYAQEATEAFLRRADGPSVDAGIAKTVPADGRVLVQAGGQDGIIPVPGGLVHHWRAVTFIRGATLADAAAVSNAYDDYHAIYSPVIASRLLGRDGNTYRVRLRIRESAGGLSAILDVTSRIEYFSPAPNTVYTISTAEEIRQVEDAGTPNERHLPAGRDSGYLWRAVTLNRLVERDGGVLVEMETLGLSRAFPPLLGWIIEPIARALGRKSVELSLEEFRKAVLAREH